MAQTKKKEAEPRVIDTSKIEGLSYLTVVQRKAVTKFDKWSHKFRYLATQGYETKEIAKILGKRYQQVRNTLVGPVPKA